MTATGRYVCYRQTIALLDVSLTPLMLVIVHYAVLAPETWFICLCWTMAAIFNSLGFLCTALLSFRRDLTEFDVQTLIEERNFVFKIEWLTYVSLCAVRCILQLYWPISELLCATVLLIVTCIYWHLAQVEQRFGLYYSINSQPLLFVPKIDHTDVLARS